MQNVLAAAVGTRSLTAVWACLALFVVHTTSAQAQTAAEFQFISALSTGDLGKAKSILQLAGNINPHNIAGKPVISYISNFGAPNALLLPDAVYNYLTVELKQSVNAQFLTSQRSVFSTFCNFLTGNMSDEEWDRRVRGIRAALASGASAREWPATSSARQQPLPSCIAAYSVQSNPHQAMDVFQLIESHLMAGADSNYELPGGERVISWAAKRLDISLLELLVKYGAKVGPVFPPSSNSHCPRNAANNTLLAEIPDPKDQDTERAREFLTAFIRLGGDIMAVQTQSNWAGSACIVGTLKQKAIGLGQVAYAQMVQELEGRSTATLKSEADVIRTKASVARTEPMALGARIATADANVRTAPSITAPLVARLTPGMQLSVEAVSPDGAWSKVTVAGQFTGWISTPVLLKASTGSVPGGAVGPLPLQQILLLITGLRTPPYQDEMISYASPGKPFQIVKRTFTYRQIDDCHIELTTEYLERKSMVVVERWSDSTYAGRALFDFTKLTAVNAVYDTDPVEALAGNPRPRKILMVHYIGKGAVCNVGKDGGLSGCTTDQPSTNYIYDPVKTPMNDLTGAFQAVRRRCLR